MWVIDRFITFYNSARFYATTNNPYSRIVDKEGTEHLYRYKFPETPDIKVPSNALQGAWALSHHVAGQMRFPNEAFVSSMTYESDSLARALGIKPKELPCLVFIDDPLSDEFHILPMKAFDDGLFSTLREIVGEFYAKSQNKKYLLLIEHWDTLQIKILELHTKIRNANQAISAITKNFPTNNIKISDLLKYDNYTQPYKDVLHWCTSIFGKEQSGYIDEILADFPKWFTTQKRFEKAEVEYQGLSEDMLENNTVRLKRLYRSTLIHLLPQQAKLDIPDSSDQWKTLFATILSTDNPIRIVHNELGIFFYDHIENLNLQKEKDKRIQPLRDNIRELENGIKSTENQILNIRAELSNIERPEIATILRKIEFAERKQVVSSYLGQAALAVGKGAETVLKAIEIGMKVNSP